MRLRRSAMYVWEFSPEHIQEVINGCTDAILFDMEDNVSPSNKAKARKDCVWALKNLDFKGKERVVRINDITTDYYALDMAEVVAAGLPDTIRLPKCETVEASAKSTKTCLKIEQSNGLEPNTIEIWAMVENPIGIRNAYDIASQIKRVTVLAIGMQDFYRNMNIERHYLENDVNISYARQKVVLDAKAAGIQCMDAGLLNRDEEINNAYSEHARRLGFDGRAVVTEREAEYANKVFFPSAATFDWAERLVAEYEKCDKENRPCIVDGMLACLAVYKHAKSILDLKKYE